MESGWLKLGRVRIETIRVIVYLRQVKWFCLRSDRLSSFQYFSFIFERDSRGRCSSIHFLFIKKGIYFERKVFRRDINDIKSDRFRLGLDR